MAAGIADHVWSIEQASLCSGTHVAAGLQPGVIISMAPPP